ncbi:transmembrane protein 79 [Xenentodon cancila]
MEDRGGSKTKQAEGGNDLVKSVMLEPGSLQWTGDGQEVGQTGKGDRLSVRSDVSLREASSWTESELGLKRGRERQEGGAAEEGAGLTVNGGKQSPHLNEDAGKNHLPEKAAQVFSPAVTILASPSTPKHSEAFWELESEKSPFLDHRGTDYNQHGYQYEWTQDMPPSRCGWGCSNRDTLKVGVSLMTSVLLFPFLVWGGFVFLPFDAPLMDNAPLRLVYSLRCAVFGAAPIVLGWLVLGISRLRSGATRPLFDNDMKEADLREVTVHRRFISDSVSLFLIYFLQLVVMAIYLSQEQLKLVPLLTILFAFGRLAYWVAAAFGSSVRGFGFGLSFLPSVAMMVANFYFIFTVEGAGSLFSLLPGNEEGITATGKQRFWG